jgi:hypothetical protein
LPSKCEALSSNPTITSKKLKVTTEERINITKGKDGHMRIRKELNMFIMANEQNSKMNKNKRKEKKKITKSTQINQLKK